MLLDLFKPRSISYISTHGIEIAEWSLTDDTPISFTDLAAGFTLDELLFPPISIQKCLQNNRSPFLSLAKVFWRVSFDMGLQL